MTDHKNPLKPGWVFDEKLIERLNDELIENIIRTPDEEIIKEAKEDFGDPAHEANKVRDMIEKAKQEAENDRPET